MQIRRATPDDAEACVAVLEELPDYFTATTHDEVRRDLSLQPSWVAEDDGRLVGFLVAPRRFERAAEITFAAVAVERQGEGIGTALVERALRALGDEGVVLVEVKTLDASAKYPPYVATRAFWERRGFVQIDCIDPLPGWEPGNPCAIYTKAISST